MSLNYQRDSYKLWESALNTYRDKQTKEIFVVERVDKLTTEELRRKLIKYKLALQPNKHINIWQRISETIWNNWGSFRGFGNSSDRNASTTLVLE